MKRLFILLIPLFFCTFLQCAYAQTYIDESYDTEEAYVQPDDLDYDDYENTTVEELGVKEYITYVLLALLPAVVLLAFILWRDRFRPEPAKELILSILMGLISVPAAMFMENQMFIWGIYGADATTWLGHARTAFFGAAIPEEFCKFAILWLYFKWRKSQNEYMDGIVYAVCIGLSFAAVENILYMTNAIDAVPVLGRSYPIALGVSRALLSVPGHFGYAVIMGFFFSLYMLITTHKKLNFALAFLIPVLFHGVYDFLLMIHSITPDIWHLVLLFALFGIFFYLQRLCEKAIRTAARLDNNPA